MMAVSGLVMVGFVVGHMVGNLKAFAGIDPVTQRYKLDEYAVYLREIGAGMLGDEVFLWIVRAVLLLSLVLHVVSGISLARLNRRARPVGYLNPDYRASNAASRTMLYGGVFLLVFIVFHILHFTTGHLHHNGFVHGQVQANVVLGFQDSLIAAVYVVAMALLALHLYHGVWSMFQTLGVDSPRWNGGIRLAAKVIAVVLFVGFSAVPVAGVLGKLPAPAGTRVGNVNMVRLDSDLGDISVSSKARFESAKQFSLVQESNQ